MKTNQQQTTLDFAAAAQARDEGIEQAVDHADAVHGDWKDQAFEYLKKWLAAYNKETFRMEQVRQASEKDGVPPAPDNRAWGAISVLAKGEGLIIREGYGPSTNPKAHTAIVSIWKKR